MVLLKMILRMYSGILLTGITCATYAIAKFRKKNTRYKENLPWLMNSEWLLLLFPVPLNWLRRLWFDTLIEEMLLWDWIVLLSISHVLVLQKSSDMLCFFTNRPWILSPFEGSSTAMTGWDLAQQPKQPLFCYSPCLFTYTTTNDKHKLCLSSVLET